MTFCSPLRPRGLCRRTMKPGVAPTFQLIFRRRRRRTRNCLIRLGTEKQCRRRRSKRIRTGEWAKPNDPTSPRHYDETQDVGGGRGSQTSGRSNDQRYNTKSSTTALSIRIIESPGRERPNGLPLRVMVFNVNDKVCDAHVAARGDSHSMW